MDIELKGAWEDALLSGLYKQGMGYLNRGGEYCCLGVLCEVAIDKGYPVERVVIDDDETDTDYTVYGYMVKGEDRLSTELLESDLLELFDMTEKQQNELANVNDLGKSFEYIVNSEEWEPDL